MLGFTYGKSTSTNNIRSFSIFLTDENDEPFKKEVKIRKGAMEYVSGDGMSTNKSYDGDCAISFACFT